MCADILNMADADSLAARQEPPRIMIVDDDREIRRALELMLRAENDVTTVETGEKAIELLRNGARFDVVLLDLRMPGRSGIECLKDIKEADPALEVLIMTAHSDMESTRKALRYGAYDYIDKPFKNEILRSAVRKGIERRRRTLSSQKAVEQLEFVKVQLKQSEKFAVLGQLIAGVVHELNNALNSVVGFSDLLMMDVSSSEEDKKGYLKNIGESAILCRNIVQKLLAFSRKHEPKKEAVDLNDVINSTLDLKNHDMKIDNIEVIKDLNEQLPLVHAAFHEIQQVFLNIINNAHHAIAGQKRERKLTIKSDADASSVRVSFQDTGGGIPKENLQKIFEPLFTTKEKGVGTGLGLSICYDIIREHNGAIYVASEDGCGACFIVELPIRKKSKQNEGVCS
jgi:signal transduction histidine kinase